MISPGIPESVGTQELRHEMNSWKAVSNNPISPEAMTFVSNELRRKRAGRVFDVLDYLTTRVQGESVLDIGVVEHAMCHVAAASWRHRHIAASAEVCLGIDILEPE